MKTLLRINSFSVLLSAFLSGADDVKLRSTVLRFNDVISVAAVVYGTATHTIIGTCIFIFRTITKLYLQH